MLLFDDRHILGKYQIRKVMIIILFRLSTIAGSKLTHNNPGIADLSDKNRPQKLGEYFSELYDNEWTEAVSGLTEGHGEEVAIHLLRDVLKVKVQKESLIMLWLFFSFFRFFIFIIFFHDFKYRYFHLCFIVTFFVNLTQNIEKKIIYLFLEL